MLLLLDPGPVLETRWLSPLVEAVDLDVDLARPHTVTAPVEVAESPLHLVTGLDGSPTRLLELATRAGLDWTDAALVTGSQLTGREAVDLAARSLSGRTKQLEALASMMTGSPDEKSVGILAALTREVSVIPVIDTDTGELVEAYEADDLLALAAVELVARRGRGESSGTCAHCGRPFFTAERADEIYCRRSAPGEAVGGRTCHRVGPQRQYTEGLSELGATYRAAYKRLDNQARRGSFSRAALDEWRQQARALLEKAERASWPPGRLTQEMGKIEPRNEGDG